MDAWDKRSDLVHWENLEGAGGEGGGSGFGMGNTCKPMAVSFQCMTKSTTNKKKKERKWSWFPFLFILPIPDNFYSILPNLCYFFFDTHANIYCHLFNFSVNFSSFYSSWLKVIFSILLPLSFMTTLPPWGRPFVHLGIKVSAMMFLSFLLATKIIPS